MDPNMALAQIEEATQDCDLDAIREHAESLIAWLDRGGFPPNGLDYTTARAFAAAALNFAEQAQDIFAPA